MLFGERWNCLLASSQTSLVSAGALLKRCADINTPDFDFSGICICATAALEAELKRVFFDGLLEYMISSYGNPDSADANEIYSKIDQMPESIQDVVKPFMNIDRIKQIALILVIIYLCSALCTYIQSISMTVVANKFARNLIYFIIY